MRTEGSGTLKKLEKGKEVFERITLTKDTYKVAKDLAGLGMGKKSIRKRQGVSMYLIL